MILLAVQGGIGNQLFQYAFARALSLPGNEPIWIDRSRYHDPKRAQLRQLELLNLTIRVDRVLPPEVSAFADGQGAEFVFEGRRFQRFVDGGQSPQTLGPRGADIALQGEWSGSIAYLYQPEFLALLRSETRACAAPQSAEFLRARDLILTAKNPVSVQVRRGEYLRLTHIFARLGADYYHAARREILNAVENPTFFVFSDDPETVRAELAPCAGLTILPAFSPVESLELARLCRHFICANSTFSFWSALLADANRVIVPRAYFTDPAAQADYAADPSFYPPDWIRV